MKSPAERARLGQDKPLADLLADLMDADHPNANLDARVLHFLGFRTVSYPMDRCVYYHNPHNLIAGVLSEQQERPTHSLEAAYGLLKKCLKHHWNYTVTCKGKITTVTIETHDEPPYAVGYSFYAASPGLAMVGCLLSAYPRFADAPDRPAPTPVEDLTEL